MYRRTAKYQAQCRSLDRARARRDELRQAGDAPDYPADLPELRVVIEVTRLDVGPEPEKHRFELYRTSRVDCYRVMVDDELWLPRAGLSRVLAGIRKAMPRIRSV